ncbi:AAA family ATPase [Micromonospora sp. WMMD998]|nr:LuxR family transcriptional regulator [Micromonospora sp. WMMD998]WFE42652.1 AAA family ATPase [Micromonospora sp. WMMD998]
MERDEQLALLERMFSDDLGPDMVVVNGPVASGKTRLLDTFARQATRHGARIAVAGASPGPGVPPFDVFRQLCPDLPLPARTGREIAERLAAAYELTTDDETDETVRQICRLLDQAPPRPADGVPLVIVVDDVHHADAASLRCLSHLMRDPQPALVRLVAAEAERVGPRPPALTALLRPARVRRTTLAMLSESGVAEVLADRCGAELARQLGAECHRVTGGNPLLVRALLDDSFGRSDATSRLVAGAAFRDAVLACLHRCEPDVLDPVRVLAVAGGGLSRAALADVLGPGAASTLPALRPGTTAGLVTDGDLGDSALARAVLDGLPDRARADLHGRVAAALHRAGAPATAIAPHLLATDPAAEPWMAQSLLDAAAQLSDTEPELAQRWLRHAAWHCDDEAQQARIRIALTDLQLRFDPDAGLRQLAGVPAAVRTAGLDRARSIEPIRHLLWFGRVTEASEVWHHATGTHPGDAADLHLSGRWIDLLFPELAAAQRDGPHRPPLDRAGAATLRTRLAGIAGLETAVRRGGDNGVVDAAEHALGARGAREPVYWTLVWPLATLVFADRLDRADAWCGALLAGPALDRLSASLLTAIRAEIALRRSDPRTAYHLADEALQGLSAPAWGVAIGLPLAVAVRALTDLGQLDEAAVRLRTPVPTVMFDSVFGLFHLRARGVHAMAGGADRFALRDFRRCGELMRRWGYDLPALVPWRTEAARALLRLGRRSAAEHLVREQLDRLGAGHPAERGAALRTLAGCVGLPDRAATLEDAIRALEVSSDRIELARALHELAGVLRLTEDHRRAGRAARRAERVVEQWSLDPYSAGRGAPGEPTWTATPLPEAVRGLTADEVRVATLTAQGHTNREIAGRLFLTTSTVEQQLTRIYRKLSVSGRGELAARLLATNATDTD